MNLVLPPKLEGVLWLALLIALAAFLISPSVSRIGASLERVEVAEARIQSHKERLAEPLQSLRPTEFASFVASSGSGAFPDQASVQAALVEGVRASGARLVDLRPQAVNVEIDGLDPLGFQLELEGDLRAALESLNALGSLECPVLLDTVQLRPVGQFERPDRRVRLSLSITCWREANA